jgi:ATP-binding cassette subfamily B protein
MCALQIADHPGAPDLQLSNAELRFDHVSFGYAPDRQVLHDLSFRVRQGQTLALVAF